jgi:hypothetical protein
MRSLALLCCTLVLVSCAKPKPQPAVDTTAVAAPPPAPAPISFADVVGKWTVRVMPQMGDSTLTTYELNATADPAGWMMTLPKRKPMALKVSVAGDSIITDMGPFASVLRKGVQVTTHGVMRLRDGKLVGTTTAHYASKGPDSVRVLRQEGTRMP